MLEGAANPRKSGSARSVTHLTRRRENAENRRGYPRPASASGRRPHAKLDSYQPVIGRECRSEARGVDDPAVPEVDAHVPDLVRARARATRAEEDDVAGLSNSRVIRPSGGPLRSSRSSSSLRSTSVSAARRRTARACRPARRSPEQSKPPGNSLPEELLRPLRRSRPRRTASRRTAASAASTARCHSREDPGSRSPRLLCARLRLSRSRARARARRERGLRAGRRLRRAGVRALRRPAGGSGEARASAPTSRFRATVSASGRHRERPSGSRERGDEDRPAVTSSASSSRIVTGRSGSVDRRRPTEARQHHCEARRPSADRQA